MNTFATPYEHFTIIDEFDHITAEQYDEIKEQFLKAMMQGQEFYTANNFASDSTCSTYRILDWDKVVELIVERRPTCVTAGLEGDWEATSTTIFHDNQVLTEADHHSGHFGSFWATPVLYFDGERIECWKESEVHIDEDDITRGLRDWPPQAAEKLRQLLAKPQLTLEVKTKLSVEIDSIL